MRSAARPSLRPYVCERFEGPTICGGIIIPAWVVCTFTVSQPVFTALSWALPVP